MIKEIENTAITISKGERNDMELLRNGNVCIGIGNYKGEKVNIWLKKIPELTLIKKLI